MEKGRYRQPETDMLLEIDDEGAWWVYENGTRGKSNLSLEVFVRSLANGGLVKLEEEGVKEEVGGNLVGRYTISPEKVRENGWMPQTIGYEVLAAGGKRWIFTDDNMTSESRLSDEKIRGFIANGSFVPEGMGQKVEGKEKGAEMAEQEQGREKVRASAKGWRIGDKIRWTAPAVDAREWAEVIEILAGPGTMKSYPDGYGIKVKWDIGATKGYYVDEVGNVYDADKSDAADLRKEKIIGMRREDRSEKLNIRKREKPKDVDIVREGTQIILPPGMTYKEGREWLQRKEDADEKEIAIFEIVDAIPLEGAYAFKRALDRIYGFTALVNTPGFFGDNPPVMIGVEVEAGVTAQVPWGRLSVPNVAGYFETGITQKDGSFKFVIQGKTKQKCKEKVSELAALTRQIAKEESIYKGKAIRVKFPTQEQVDDGSVGPLDNQPKFLVLDHVVEADLIFPQDVQDLVETAIFVPIEKRERCQAEGVPFKRGILLEGPWGTGKTLTADVTAKKATRHGITFIYLENVKDLEQGLRFAALYAPAVVFAEDIDQVGKDDRHDDESPLNTILNTLDGVDMKNSEIMAVLTTNYINDIEQGLLRPGRIDAVIPVRPPDAVAASKLVALYARGRLEAGIDLTLVGRKLSGQIPAVIREVVERSKLEAIGRLKDGEALVLTARDLERASNSMLTHLELLKPKVKDTRSEREKAADIMAKAITGLPAEMLKQETAAHKELLASAETLEGVLG